MPTPLSAIVARTRDVILAPLVQIGSVAPDTFWADAELLNHVIAGCRDLWRAIVDLHQEHYLKVDPTGVSAPAQGDRLIGVPTDLLRVLMLAPRDQTSRIEFKPRRYTSSDFQTALRRTAIDPSENSRLFYAVANAGSPVGAPDIYIAPALSTAIPLRLVYVPTLPGTLNGDSINPIPGESDQALMNWCAAFALGKQNPDGTYTPDAGWLNLYSTEKQAILIVSEPRQEQQPVVMQGVFDELFGGGLSGDGEGW